MDYSIIGFPRIGIHIPPAAQTNKELLLDYILRERRVELYHEKSRFFSTRFYLEPTSPEELANTSPLYYKIKAIPLFQYHFIAITVLFFNFAQVKQL